MTQLDNNDQLKLQVQDTGLYASNGNRQASAWWDIATDEYHVDYGDMMMPADYRCAFDTWEDAYADMLDFAPADKWTDDDEEISPSFNHDDDADDDDDDDDDPQPTDDPAETLHFADDPQPAAETPTYGYFAACTYGGNSWELHKSPEQQVGPTGDYMRDLRAKVASIDLGPSWGWVTVYGNEGKVSVQLGSRFNKRYSPYNDEPMFLVYENIELTPEEFEATYPTLAAASRAAGDWEQHEMVKFDHSWRPKIN